jgi:hypothetical protein
MRMQSRTWNWMTAGLVILATAGAAAAAEVAAPDESFRLEKSFVQPPDSARPWVYWFWLNGNITREGITADLESMRRVGVGGVLIMEVDQGAPLGPVDFMSERWRTLFKHVVAEAGRLGLEVNMNNDAGWNGSGGPWVKPEQSMQKVVVSETGVTGPKTFAASLPHPETVAGFYRDIAVLAFPTPGSFRIADIAAKAAFQVGGGAPIATQTLPKEMVIQRNQIVDLTSRMDNGGRLAWDVPAGSWTILRIGHTSTGAKNAPAPASGQGLECDKLSKEGVEANFNGMMARLIEDVGPAAGKALAATHVDSWENGSQNWTARMREEFCTRRGYDILPFLPVMTGRVVGSLEISERFLWDLRRTISELVVENYAGHLRQLAHRGGLRFTIEAYGSPCDNLPYAAECDEPMGEFWVGGSALNTCKGMASAAHLGGKSIVGAESFTAGDQERWRDHPATIKALGDQAFSEGINRFVFHRFAMQPWLDRRPGMTMGPWGTHFERTQTWWELTPDWHRYLARCQFLLRQGTFVADLCCLEAEDSPQSFHERPRLGYDYDQCYPEIVISKMAVQDGRLVLPGGMSYRLLVLSDARRMTPPLLRKIKKLIEAGATVVGPRPTASPSLTNYPRCDEEVRNLADEIWANCDGTTVQEHRLGLGRVVWGQTPERVLAKLDVGPDFSSTARLRFIHRHAKGADLYFVCNPAVQRLTATATFRVSGKTPELWWPDSGRTEPAAMFRQCGGLTQVELTLDPSGSVFVLFRRDTPQADAAVALSRNGVSLALLGEPAPKIVIERALYGVPGDPARTRDVGRKVRQKVADHEYRFPVTDMATGDDPALNVRKTLTVDYSIENRHFTVRGMDGDAIQLSGDAVRATIDTARYGVLDDPKRTRDVRVKLQKMIDAGGNGFQVASLAAGDDPASGIVKTLVMEYTLGGKHLTATGTDPETVLLGSIEPSPLVAQMACGADGQLSLEAWQPGRYEVKLASGRTRQVAVAQLPPPQEFNRPWDVTFPAKSGLAKPLRFERLVSWTDRSEPSVKYFSGTAVYQADFQVGSDWQPDRPSQPSSGSTLSAAPERRLWLDLGEVQAFARVQVNGKDFGLLWKPPFRLDVTDAVSAGENRLEVSVTNLWPNRMIGDEQLPEDSLRNPDGTLKSWPDWLRQGKPSPTGRQTFTTWRLWKKNDPLLKSGLLGPVRLVPCERVPLPR